MQTFDLLLELEHISKTDPQVRPLNFCFVTPTAGSYSFELFLHIFSLMDNNVNVI